MATYVLFALRPPRPRRSSPWRVSFWLGYLVNELPFLAFLVLAASTALAIAQGDIATPVGWIGLGLAVLASVGLVVIVRRALGASAAIDEALIEAGLPPRTRRRLPWARILLWQFPFPHPGVERIRTSRTATRGAGTCWTSTALGPARRAARRSSICMEERSASAARAARRGRSSTGSRVRAGSASARTTGCASPFPDPLVDVKKVIAWVREHGAEYGADPNVVFVAGSSAGGYLASMAALTANDPALQPGFEEVDTSVAAVVSLYGYYGSTGPGARSGPMGLDADGAPPFFVVHPDRDTLVVVEDARASSSASQGRRRARSSTRSCRRAARL